MTTPYGITYDIANSAFKATTCTGLTFHFTSRKHRDKFLEKLDTHISAVEGSLSRRFHVKVEAYDLASVQLYTRIETGAFYVVDEEGNVARCPEELLFVGLTARCAAYDRLSRPTTERLIG